MFICGDDDVMMIKQGREVGERKGGYSKKVMITIWVMMGTSLSFHTKLNL